MEFLCSHLLIHDCEEAIEIKSKGIKHGYRVKCEHRLEIKRKFMLALKWRENIFGLGLTLKLLEIWLGWIWQLLNFKDVLRILEVYMCAIYLSSWKNYFEN